MILKRILIIVSASLISLPVIFVLAVAAGFLLELWVTGAPSMHALTGSPGSGIMPVILAALCSILGAVLVGFFTAERLGCFSREQPPNSSSKRTPEKPGAA